MNDDKTLGQQLLQDFHRRHPGATSRSLAHGRTADGESSYDLLCNAAQQAPHNATIVDLGCGDGYLLELVRGALPGSYLVGVDMSRAEVDAAKERLAGSQPELLVACAQSLPLADASVEVVLCHMALMLMENVERVVSEIARVLRPGGVVAIVVSSGSWPKGAGQTFKRLVREAVDQFGGACPRLGDKRTHSTDGLLSLFDRATGFEVQVAPELVTLALDDAPDKVRASLELMYNFAALSQDGRDYVAERFLDAVTGDVDDHGRLPYRSSLLYASFRRLLDSSPRSAPTDGGQTTSMEDSQ
ncbi:MAG: class I SAM-dependent methyltransferase [Myxococcota bacterium]